MAQEHQRIAVIGLGVEGLDAVDYYLLHKAAVTGYDQKKAAEFPKTVQKLREKGVNLFLGPGYLDEGLLGYDVIIRSPGVHPGLGVLQSAAAAGVVVSSVTNLFFNLCPAQIIGVTGTKGKGTTATLIHHILEADGRVVHLLGNIGQPPLEALRDIQANHWVVYELSSFQLIDLEKSPQVAVVLFVATDHLDYHATREEYVESKSHIVRYQSKEDWVVANGDDGTARDIAQSSPGKKIYYSVKNDRAAGFMREKRLMIKLGTEQEVIGAAKDLILLGEHNWQNILAASLAARVAGVDIYSIRKAVFAFSGLPHRLEKVGEAGEVSFYNDSFSTTPDTAIAAIRSFTEPIALIVGGSDKGANFSHLGKEIVFSPVKVLVAIGQMGPKIAKAAIEAGFSGEVVWNCDSMEAAVREGVEKVGSQGVVLLSPACASFDMFTNYKERGEHFRLAVQRFVCGQSQKNTKKN